MSQSDQDTLQWLYGMMQSMRASYDRMEDALRNNRVIDAHYELKNCKDTVSIGLHQLLQLAERLGIKIKNYPYVKDDRIDSL